MRYFTAEECSNLIGKRKLFIFQACRGLTEQQGLFRKSASDSNSPQWRTDAIPTSPGREPLVTSWSDIAVAYSSIPDHVSYRNLKEGSVFLRELYKVFMNNSHCLHLADLLNQVSRALDQFETEDLQKQTCCIEYRNFWKRLYFVTRNSVQE